MGIPRNDFWDAYRQSDYRDEDQYREDREYWRVIPPPLALSAEDRASELHYAQWQQQRIDAFSMGHVAYQEKYGTVSMPSDRYIPMARDRNLR